MIANSSRSRCHYRLARKTRVRIPNGISPESSSLGYRHQSDSMSELLETMDVVMCEALGCQSVEVIRAEVAIGNPFAQNVIGRDQDAVAHGDRSLLLTAPPAQARILSAEIRALGAAGSPA